MDTSVEVEAEVVAVTLGSVGAATGEVGREGPQAWCMGGSKV
jgi:hypothetical protein